MLLLFRETVSGWNHFPGRKMVNSQDWILKLVGGLPKVYSENLTLDGKGSASVFASDLGWEVDAWPRQIEVDGEVWERSTAAHNAEQELTSVTYIPAPGREDSNGPDLNSLTIFNT